MYDIQRHTRRFNTENTLDMQSYDTILNNPLCSIIREASEKITEKDFQDGQMVNVHEMVILVVTWDEKILL
ncbi:MAG: hypothetical protein EBZ49_00160 [Proteobacteria bacterium]|nr:hypothetical protein [Pseudomonadota bacterium]